MSSANVETSNLSIIISPNLGRPFFLTMDPKLKKETFQTEILIISNILDPVDFEKEVKDKRNKRKK